LFYQQEYLIVSRLSFNHVGSEAFITYTRKLAGESLIIRGRTFFTKKVEQLFEVRRKQLADTLEKIDFVATTADGWSSPHRKKIIGETVHWFNERNKRISGCLTIKRVIGPTTYLVIGRLLEKNHSDFNISGKVSMMTTDNGSNFLKLAREFSVHSGAPEFDEEQCDEEYDHVEFLNLSTILSNLPQPSQLPRGVLQNSPATTFEMCLPLVKSMLYCGLG
jgi:hypothetical protein